MKNLIKRIFIIAGGLVLFIILALILIPFFVDMGKYKAPLEKKISASIGRTFSIKGELSLSLFPWAGFSFKDLYLGNPEGFKEKDFIQIKEFEARVKLLPLISRNIQIKRFVMDTPRLLLIQQKSGRTNLDGLIPQNGTPEDTGKTSEDTKASGGLLIKSLEVGEFSITHGSLILIDEGQNTRQEITDITLQLNDVALEKPVKLDFSATIDKLPVAIKGQFGPVGNPPGKTDMPLDLSISALGQITTRIQGKISNPTDTPSFDLAIQTDHFSPKKVLSALGQMDAFKPSDPAVLETMSFSANVKGNASTVNLSNGILKMDDSTMEFKADVTDFNKPDVSVQAHLDALDMDRYLPKKETKPGASEPPPGKSSSNKTDYKPLRSLVLDLKFSAGEMKANHLRIKNLTTDITGSKGVFLFNPVALEMYEGKVIADGQANFKTDTPAISLNLTGNNIQSNPFLKDFMNKDFIEGAVNATMNLRMSGENGAAIKRSLNGKGNLAFKDGAIKGVDITAMVQNVKTAFGAGGGQTSSGRTDFSELVCPFDITNGVVQTQETRLVSPIIRVNANGKADLNTKTLNFRIDPKFVSTLKGQGDTRDRSGVSVPVLVTGTFSSPKFAPDMEALIQEGIKGLLPKVPGLKGLFPGESSSETKEEESSNPLQDGVKGLLKGLPFGR
ncbi:MAG: AsmA family protein [Proteobacteria bacterium]|nr:AsmA family protein [Pseudomonadota bacterium]MBU4469132.1 AsmA family protein [Pseudomonadota bacterium]MCG2752164.1 AsmA family protein [Desulfobacteraceae bacterium]